MSVHNEIPLRVRAHNGDHVIIAISDRRWERGYVASYPGRVGGERRFSSGLGTRLEATSTLTHEGETAVLLKSHFSLHLS